VGDSRQVQSCGSKHTEVSIGSETIQRVRRQEDATGERLQVTYSNDPLIDYDNEGECPTHPGIECEYSVDDEGNPECPCHGDCCRIEDIGFKSDLGAGKEEYYDDLEG
jgi:hypothetical protein